MPKKDLQTPLAPPLDCPRCERLVAFHDANREKYPHFHNAPVPSFGALDARFLVVGLAPGLKGANATGRPFTGDYAGDVLYPALLTHGFARGQFGARADDGLELVDARITNAVRCVPPENKPTTQEIAHCNAFLHAEILAMPNLRVVLALGLISHKAILKALGYKQSAFAFGHGAEHILPNHPFMLLNSYHCSRYNINTNRLTVEMFDEVLTQVRAQLRTAEAA